MADALDSGSSGSNPLQVQVLLSAPVKNKTNIGYKSMVVIFYNSFSKILLDFKKKQYSHTKQNIIVHYANM